MKTLFKPKIDKVRAISRKYLKIFKENISNTNFEATLMILTLDPFGCEMFYLGWSVTYYCYRSPPPHLFSWECSNKKKIILKKLTEAPKNSHFGDSWWLQPCIRFTQTQYFSPSDPYSSPQSEVGLIPNIYYFRILGLSLWVVIFYSSIQDFFLLEFMLAPRPPK